jgi:hypothetical protein
MPRDPMPVDATSAEPPVQAAPMAPVAAPPAAAEQPGPSAPPAPAQLASQSGAPLECLPAPLRAVLDDLQSSFGPVTVVSTTHLHTDNHEAGSVRAKMHPACRAVDIRTARDPKEVVAFLRSRPEIGGVNSYRNRIIHFDLNQGYRTSARGR